MYSYLEVLFLNASPDKVSPTVKHFMTALASVYRLLLYTILQPSFNHYCLTYQIMVVHHACGFFNSCLFFVVSLLH